MRKKVLNNHGYVERKVEKHKYKVGDKVRISRLKGIFEK